MTDRLNELKSALLADRMAEFELRGVRYLIQQENNKGWDYLGIWRISDPPDCLGRALFDLCDGVDEASVEELLSLPCIEGRTMAELLPECEGFCIL